MLLRHKQTSHMHDAPLRLAYMSANLRISRRARLAQRQTPDEASHGHARLTSMHACAVWLERWRSVRRSPGLSGRRHQRRRPCAVGSQDKEASCTQARRLDSAISERGNGFCATETVGRDGATYVSREATYIRHILHTTYWGPGRRARAREGGPVGLQALRSVSSYWLVLAVLFLIPF